MSRALYRHLEANPEMRARSMTDPVYAATLHGLAEILDRLEGALRTEGLPADARDRVTAQVILDYLGTDALNAIRRQSLATLLAYTAKDGTS